MASSRKPTASKSLNSAGEMLLYVEWNSPADKKQLGFRKTKEIYVPLDENVDDLKRTIFEHLFKVDPSKQRLVFGGQVLAEDQTLKHYGIHNDDTVKLTTKKDILIKVKNCNNGQVKDVLVSIDVDVATLKEIITEHLFSVAPAQQILTYKGNTLENSRNLASYNIKYGDEIVLTIQLRGGASPTKSRISPHGAEKLGLCCC